MNRILVAVLALALMAYWVFNDSLLKMSAFQIQYVVVEFEEDRGVLVDGNPNGRTGESIRVDGGTYEFTLDGEQNYSPDPNYDSFEVLVTKTSVLSPLILRFQLNEE